LHKPAAVKNPTDLPCLQASIPIDISKWDLPLWKAFHKGNYRKFLFMERSKGILLK
jgi:hypothetical protein